MARMSRWLISNGHQVTLLVEKAENWKDTLPSEARCIVLGKQFREFYYYFHAKRLWKSLAIPKPDVIKSFDLPSSWVACQLATIVGDDCKVITGLYGSFYFKWYYPLKTLRPWDPMRTIVQNYLRDIPESARLVCGADQIEELEEVHGEKCILWPIPIDTKIFKPSPRKPKWGKIVSVGRMDVMKRYNLYMVNVVKELLKKGLDVTWSVYGTGDHEPEIRQRIKQEGLEHVISLEGTVPYHRFWEVLSDAYVFVGMGTAILEAALFKVPNVYAIAYDHLGVTYGPVYQGPPGSIGPGLASPPTLKVSDEIERILRLSPEAYETEQKLNYQHVQHNEMDASMNQFLRLVREADPIKRSKFAYLANYTRWLIHRVVNGLYVEKQIPHPDMPFYGSTKVVQQSTRDSLPGIAPKTSDA